MQLCNIVISIKKGLPLNQNGNHLQKPSGSDLYCYYCAYIKDIESHYQKALYTQASACIRKVPFY